MGAQRATPKARRLLLPRFGGANPSSRPRAPEPRLQEARPAGRRPREPLAPSPTSPDLLGHMLSSDSGCHTGRSRRDGAAGPRGLGGPRRQGVLPALCPGPAQGPERPALRVLSFWAHPCQAGLRCGRPGGGQQRPPGPAVQPALPGTVWKRGHAPTCRARGSGSGTAPASPTAHDLLSAPARALSRLCRTLHLGTAHLRGARLSRVRAALACPTAPGPAASRWRCARVTWRTLSREQVCVGYVSK